MGRSNNYAFIDSQNLNLAIRDLGWELDFARFRIYLSEKYRVSKAYLFIGYIEKNVSLYRSLQEKGYILIFKPTLTNKDGKVKGNCDAELVLQAMIHFGVYDGAVIVTGDGDFHCLVDYLLTHQKLVKLLIPSEGRCSVLLKRFPSRHIAFVSDLISKMAFHKRKERREDGTSQSAFRGNLDI